jgi:hypothetical protein
MPLQAVPVCSPSEDGSKLRAGDEGDLDLAVRGGIRLYSCKLYLLILLLRAFVSRYLLQSSSLVSEPDQQSIDLSQLSLSLSRIRSRSTWQHGVLIHSAPPM